MDVMILECVPTALRGQLSRWLTPVGGGVHVGRISALVRDLLWSLAVSKVGDGRVIQIWQCNGEPGYRLRVHGLRDAELVDLEGLPMIAIRDAAWREAMARFSDRGGVCTMEIHPGDISPS
jgi:CRISPR-associated protein Cas2